MTIAVFRALKLGDFLCAVPALKKLKTWFPDATLIYIGLPSMETIVSTYHFIDEFIAFPGCEGLPEQACCPEDTAVFIEELRRKQIDLLIQLHGDGTVVNELLAKVKAKRLVGYCSEWRDASTDFMCYPENIHEIIRHLKLLEFLGIPRQDKDERIDFPLTERNWLSYLDIVNRYDLHNYVVVHIGASVPARQWPMENFHFLTVPLIQQGYMIILSGSAHETDRAEQFISGFADGRLLNLCGKTDLGTLACLLQESELLISNCTGVSHLAAAVEAKSIVISLDGEPERWGPLNRELHYTINGLQENDLEKLRVKVQKVLNSLP